MTSLNERAFVRSIAKLWRCCRAAGVGELFSNPSSLTPSAEFKHLALDGSARYEDLYLTGLRQSDYNIQLVDYSYFQFSLSGASIRSAYYPNPFFGASTEAMTELGEKHEYLAEGVISMEDFLHELSELWSPRHPPQMRYEYDPDSYVELSHPASHLHVGMHSENRWPVQRVLSPEAFGMMVIRLYYYDYWRNTGEQVLGTQAVSLDEIYRRVKSDCSLLEADTFSDAESQHFYLA